MLERGFSVCYSPLSLLKINEEGVITRIKNNDKTINKHLLDMGVNIGLPIKLEQRTPNFIIKVGKSYMTCDQETARGIYVRIVNDN
jgi:Fe2+ transport system protein FeoA